MSEMDIERQKQAASAWFAELRDRMCAAFEALEDGVKAPNDAAGDGRPGRRRRRR